MIQVYPIAIWYEVSFAIAGLPKVSRLPLVFIRDNANHMSQWWVRRDGRPDSIHILGVACSCQGRQLGVRS